MVEVLSVRRQRCAPMTEEHEAPVPAAFPFWVRPISIFGLFLITTFIESSRLLTMPSSPAHLHLMLVDTPFPHGSGAAPTGVGPWSEGFRRRVTLPPYLVGYC
jgi:hypothetical protein